MRLITRIAMLLFTVSIVLLAFRENKCDHVFTSIEPGEIKIERSGLPGDHEYVKYSYPSGKQEGQELICVKCFHRQKKIVDYGEPWRNDHPCNYFDMKHQIDTMKIVPKK